MLYLKKVARLEPPACLVIEAAVSAAVATGAGSRFLGLTNSLTAPQFRAIGADWTAPDHVSGPWTVLDC